LTQVIARILDGSPCYVGFSGGCDSSLVLSAATAASRAVGCQDPIPVTYRYATSESDERGYQEAVVRHLRLREWITLDMAVDGDLLSPAAREELRTCGPIWPAAPLTRARALRTLGEGLWLTGEGGDEVLGPRRASYGERAARTWLRRPYKPPWTLLRRGMAEMVPRPLRRQAAEAALTRDYRTEWLDADLRQRYLRDAAELAAEEPLRPSDWFGHYLARPSVTVGHAAVRAFHARCGLRWEAPLVDTEFLGSMRASLRWYDYRGRRHLLRALFSDFLPDEIIDRRTKARFNGALFGPCTRDFAARWDGEGTPHGVDGEWLKEHWQSQTVSAGTASLLHHVWLASEGTRAGQAGARCR
jgi:asparagine synthase (glutamine-hydrolysing)